MAVRFQLRRDTAANWISANSVLALGEPGVETDTLKVKVGDGSTAWNSLGYSITKDFADLTNTPTTLAAYGITDALSLVQLSVTQNNASGNGALTYNNATGVFEYTPPNFEGLNGNFTGSVFADDSSVMVDGVSGKIVGQLEVSDPFINGTIDSTDSSPITITPEVILSTGLTVGNHIIPSSNVNIDLGSNTNRFRELFLSGNTISLDNLKLSCVPATGTLQIHDGNGTLKNIQSHNINANDITANNITTTGYIAGPAVFTIDPAAVGDNTGKVVIAGDLQVDGTQTTINSTTVAIDDLNFSIATDAADSAAANGAGITVGGAGATLNYTHATTSWDMNKPLNVTGNIGVTGTVDGVDIATRDGILGTTTTTANAALPKAGGTMSGNIAMDTNDITGAGTISATTYSGITLGGSLSGDYTDAKVQYGTSYSGTPAQGSFFFDSLNAKLKVYNGSSFVDAVPAGAGGGGGGGASDATATFRKYNYDITSTTNSVSGKDSVVVTAGAFVIGYQYEILSVGDTDFQAIGASADTVGVTFTATGAGSGTGTAGHILNYVTDGTQNVEVYRNGAKMVEGASDDYVATTGTSVNFTFNLADGDVVDVQVYELLTQDSFYTKTETYTQAQVNSNIATAVADYLPLAGGTIDAGSNNGTLLGVTTTGGGGSNIDIVDGNSTVRMRNVDGRLHLTADVNDEYADSEIRFLVDNSSKMTISDLGNVRIGGSGATDEAQLQLASNSNVTGVFTASISGTTLTVTAVTSGAIVVGDRISDASIEPNTVITALGTGTGGIGTYTVSISQTATSQTLRTVDKTRNLLLFKDTDTSMAGGTQLGTIEFESSDTNNDGTKAFITAHTESAAAPTSLVFGTATSGQANAQARMIINSEGDIGVNASDPQGSIHVRRTGTASLVLEGDTDNSGDTGQRDAEIIFLNDGSAGNDPFGGTTYGAHGYRISTENFSGKTSLGFDEWHSADGYITRLQIDGDGNVGIGKAVPAATLDVLANHASNYIAVFKQSHADNLGTVQIDTPADNNGRGSRLDFARGGVNKWKTGMVYGDTTDGWAVGDATDGGTALQETRLLIEPDGTTVINSGHFTSNPTGSMLNVFADGEALRLDGTGNTSRTLRFRGVSTSNPGIIEADGTLKIQTEDANTKIQLVPASGTVDIVHNSSTTGQTVSTLLNLRQDFSDIQQQQTAIDFTFTDSNTNEIPQARITAQPGPNADADTQTKEGEGALIFYTNNATGEGSTATGLDPRMKIDHNGHVTMYNQPVALYYNVTTDTNPVDGDIIAFDTAAGMNRGITDSNARSRFTVPADGIYAVAFTIGGSTTAVSAGDGLRIVIEKNGSVYATLNAYNIESAGSAVGMEYSFKEFMLVDMTAGQYVELVWNNIGGTQFNVDHGNCNIYKVA